jgi:hypothetical protein
VSLIPNPEHCANPLAALLLLARVYLNRHGLAQVSAKAVLEATGATKTRAYELADVLSKRLDELAAPRGRPVTRGEAKGEHGQTLLKIARAGLEYLHAQPGAAQHSERKSYYSDGFRDFVVSQCEAHPGLDVADVAHALALPATTVCDWLRAARAQVERASDSSEASKASASEPVATSSSGSPSGLQIQTVLAQWSSWKGTFVAFCEHLRRDHGVPLGRTSISTILAHLGERKIRKRPGRSPNERALRDAFVSFFPGAVWVGDGSEIVVEVEGQRFGCNLELFVDANSDAFVGLDVRDHEDSHAVIAAFADGVEATSNPPLAVLLDNKACNHAPAVHEATEGSLVIPATKARPQNKAHVEGAFGLFSQCAPPLRVDGETPKDRAQSLALLCVRLFFAAMNMRPRHAKKGRSRIELYRDGQPTPEQVERARAALEERLAMQLAAQRTLRERQDPAKRAYLDEALARLGLSDPAGHVQAAIAGHSLSDIVDGVATFLGKQRAKTLPEGVDIRYLLGIIMNIIDKREGQAIATALWDERIAAREHTFACLLDERDALSKSGALILDFVDKALATELELERYFWIDVVAKLVLAEPAVHRKSLFERVARRVHTSYRVPRTRRQHVTRELAAKLLPLA